MGGVVLQRLIFLSLGMGFLFSLSFVALYSVVYNIESSYTHRLSQTRTFSFHFYINISTFYQEKLIRWNDFTAWQVPQRIIDIVYEHSNLPLNLSSGYTGTSKYINPRRYRPFKMSGSNRTYAFASSLQTLSMVAVSSSVSFCRVKVARTS